MALALCVAIFVLVYGKDNSFLVINKYNNPSFDYVFRFWTYLGDGLIWIPLFVYIILYRRDFLLAAIAGVVISTLITYGLKHLVFADSYRPGILMKDKAHFIKGVVIHTSNSFPSGHTTTAFTLALLMAYIVKKDLWVYIFPLIAFFVGYSRVYLAQHFVTDVFAGMLTGIVSSCLALLIYHEYKRKAPKTQSRKEEVL